MRTVKLHESQGHPVWNAGEYIIERPDGTFVELPEIKYGSYAIEVEPDGIYLFQCSCGSGYGKAKLSQFKSVLLVPKADYDTIEYVGEKKELTEDMIWGMNESISSSSTHQ